jgi:hypothetical protein
VALDEWLLGIVIGSPLAALALWLGFNGAIHNIRGTARAVSLPAVFATISFFISFVALRRRRAFYISTSKAYMILGNGRAVRELRKGLRLSYRENVRGGIDVCFRSGDWAKSKMWRTRRCFVATSNELLLVDPGLKQIQASPPESASIGRRILDDLGLQNQTEADGIDL